MLDAVRTSCLLVTTTLISNMKQFHIRN